MRRALPAAAALALPLALAASLRAAPPSPAKFGPHGGLVPGDERGCMACHPGEPSMVGIGKRELLIVPPGGHAALRDAVARLCWRCHRPGNPYGARPIPAPALAATAHGVRGGLTARPDAWTPADALRGRGRATDQRHSQSSFFSCTACHDPHDRTAPHFLRDSTPGGDYTALCSDCHPGRVNAGLAGADNIFALDAGLYSTHPAGAAMADLPGNGPTALAPRGRGDDAVTCGSCHEVHGAGGDAAGGLLRLRAGERVSDLCRRCHPPDDPLSSHPMEEGRGRLPYPVDFASADGVPAAWKAAAHLDDGAEGFVVGARRGPRCASCHDAHGGQPMTSILYGPTPSVTAAPGDWCSSCHPDDAVTPPDHAVRAPDSAGRACADCHGRASGAGPASWRAHGGFRELRAPAPATDPETGLPPVERQRRAVLDRLALALLGDLPIARANAADVLARLGDPAALETILAALADPRPEVQRQAMLALGAMGGEGVVAALGGIARDGRPELRRAAVEALARVGGEPARGALVPLLGDPDPEVRRAAAKAFSGVRDPRAYPGLFALLRDRDEAVRREARESIGWINDARLLEMLLRAPDEVTEIVPALLTVMRRLTDPAAGPLLREAIAYPQRLVRIGAAEALERYPGPETVDVLVASLESGDERFRKTAVNSLTRVGDRRAIGALLPILATPREAVGIRRLAARALVQLRSPEAVPLLIDALADPSPLVQQEASHALVTLTCRDFGQEQERWRSWWALQSPVFQPGDCSPAALPGAGAQSEGDGEP